MELYMAIVKLEQESGADKIQFYHILVPTLAHPHGVWDHCKQNPAACSPNQIDVLQGHFWIIIIIVFIALAVILGLYLLHKFRKRRLHRAEIVQLNSRSDTSNGNERQDLDLPLLDFEQIAKATDDFSFRNKLGEGAFGTVYKVLSRISVLGSAFLEILAGGPALIEQTTHLTAFRGFAGTSVLILVGCATDTARKVQAEIISQKYMYILNLELVHVLGLVHVKLLSSFVGCIVTQ